MPLELNFDCVPESTTCPECGSNLVEDRCPNACPNPYDAVQKTTRNYTCPVCDYAELHRPPTDYMICPQCGTEFGTDDSELTHAQLREAWITGGKRFWRTEIKKQETE